MRYTISLWMSTSSNSTPSNSTHVFLAAKYGCLGPNWRFWRFSLVSRNASLRLSSYSLLPSGINEKLASLLENSLMNPSQLWAGCLSRIILIHSGSFLTLFIYTSFMQVCWIFRGFLLGFLSIGSSSSKITVFLAPWFLLFTLTNTSPDT